MHVADRSEAAGSNPIRVPLRPSAPGLSLCIHPLGPGPPPRRAGSRASLLPGRGARREAVSSSAVEAFGAAVCGGHFAEEPGAGGMQMRQSPGGERRSPEETGGRAPGRRDGCLPRGREEGGGEEPEAVGAAFWVRLGPAWRLGRTHPPPPSPPPPGSRFLNSLLDTDAIHCVGKLLTNNFASRAGTSGKDFVTN